MGGERRVISFDASDDRSSITVVDDIERRQYTFQSDSDVSLTSADPSDFFFPVEEATALGTDALHLPNFIATYLRDEAGEMLDTLDPFGTIEYGEGEYSVELCGPIKMYLRAEGPITVSAGIDDISIETAGEIVLGARGHHKKPATTVTTTGEPHDLMEAVSMLGSALKTDSPERSYPTLRGHPPTIELGDELHVPDRLEKPETGITLELPPDRSYIYSAASLAYYLGADVVPGSDPRIVTEDGFEYDLEGVSEFETNVERVLKQVFLLDCLTRTEGYYEVDLHERQQVEERVDVDFAALYDQSPSERLANYLEIPFSALEAQVPEWKLTTHVAPTADNAELLPFLVNDLAVIRMPTGQSVSASEAQMAAIDEFTRGDEFTRSVAGGGNSLPLVQPETTDSIEQAWASDDTPIGASKVSVQAYRNKLDREAAGDDIEITVVCNDPAMEEEQDVAASVYGSREEFPFEVNIYHDLSKAALKTVLETDLDFLHYIGHIDEEGFECADGKLDVRELDDVGVDAFILNACQSYDQGMALIERGAIGGVVTLADVINSGAVRVGRTIAKLLNQGFPLRAALDIAKDRSIVGGQYIVVGDGNVDVVQLESNAPIHITIDSLGDDEFEVTYRTYPTESLNLGSLTSLIVDQGRHYLSSGEIDTVVLSRDELWQVLGQESLPLSVDGTFTWSGDVDVEKL
jgi:hypothetical protein